MTASNKNYDLLPDLPSFPPPPIYPLNLYELVPHLLNLNPDWIESDIEDFVEERTRRRLHAEERTTLTVLIERHNRLEEGFEG